MYRLKVEKAETQNGKDKAEEAKAFDELCESDWSAEISSNALKTLEDRQWNAPTVIPVSSQVTAMNDYIPYLKFHEVKDLNGLFNEAQLHCHLSSMTH